jgi:pseudouridine kinase
VTRPSLLVVGGCILDVAVTPEGVPRDATSNDSRVRLNPGGAACNVARNLVRLGARVTLVSAVGDDEPGRILRAELETAGVAARLATRRGTAVYVGVLTPEGDLARGYCDPGGLEELSSDELLGGAGALSGFDGGYLDANLAETCLSELAAAFRNARLPYALEPVCVEKALRLRGALRGCALVKPNRLEAQALTGIECSLPAGWQAAADRLRVEGAAAVALSLGSAGLYLCCDGFRGHHPAAGGTIRDTSGAGDALMAAGLLGVLSGAPPPVVASAMLRCAALACASPEPVSASVGPEVLW